MLLLSALTSYAQDKVFLRDGKVINCKIEAISENSISYIDTLQGSTVITLPKREVLLTEFKSGTIYMFSDTPGFNVVKAPTAFSVTPVDINETREQRKARKMQEWKDKEALLSNNILGFYIPELVLGRLTVSYERLFANKSIGVKIPFSLTYDGLGALAENSANNSNSNSSSTNTNSSSTNTNSSSSSSSNNTNNGAVQRTRGTGFITGIDVSYYHDLTPGLKYYFGPRVRYGTDMTLGGIEGLTFQIQNGIFRSRGKRMTSTIGFGVGFFKLSERYAGTAAYDSKQVYPWASFTWRLGFRL